LGREGKSEASYNISEKRRRTIKKQRWGKRSPNGHDQGKSQTKKKALKNSLPPTGAEGELRINTKRRLTNIVFAPPGYVRGGGRARGGASTKGRSYKTLETR